MYTVVVFSWVKGYLFIQAHSIFRGLVIIAYGSMFPQIVVAISFFSRAKTRGQAEELWWSTMIALIITSFLSGLLPALGTFSYYETSLDLAVHLPDLLALREGTMLIFPVAVLKGIITFPSFHAASAILLTYPYRHCKSLFGIVCVINGMMLLSIPSQGCHYLVDVIAGVLVAVLSIFIFRKMTRFKFAGHAAQINSLQVS